MAVFQIMFMPGSFYCPPAKTTAGFCGSDCRSADSLPDMNKSEHSASVGQLGGASGRSVSIVWVSRICQAGVACV